MPIIKWDPFNELDELLEDDSHIMPMLKAGWDLAVDIYEKDNNIIAEMNIPGIDHDKVEIIIDDDLLKISGSREQKEEINEENYCSKEIRRGSFERIITLPNIVEAEKADAEYKNGVLKVIMPKKENAQGHKVKVKAHT
jgi:HSP20 family protein